MDGVDDSGCRDDVSSTADWRADDIMGDGDGGIGRLSVRIIELEEGLRESTKHEYRTREDLREFRQEVDEAVADVRQELTAMSRRINDLEKRLSPGGGRHHHVRGEGSRFARPDA